MRILEKTLWILIILATLGKLVPVVGTGIIITFAALTLSFLYFIFGFAIFTRIGFRQIFKKDNYKHLKPVDIILSVITGMAFQTTVCGLLFQLQYWPGARVMSFAGLITSLPFIIIAAFLLKAQNRYVYIAILKRGIPLFLALLFLHLTPVTTKLKIFKVSDPEIKGRIINDAKAGNY